MPRHSKDTAIAEPSADSRAAARVGSASPAPEWARSLATLDLSRLAEGFKPLLQNDPAAALQWWKARCALVPQPLRPVFGRLVDERLDALDRVALRRSKAGQAFLLQRAIERKNFRPRLPNRPFWTASLAYDMYASLLLSFGSAPAKKALLAEELVLLALRRESSTLAYQGRGSYDDHLVVLNGEGWRRRVVVFPVCTEPGAQYSQRASLQPVKPRSSIKVDVSPPKSPVRLRLDDRYADVKYKHNEGVDVDKDGIRDAGRLTAGTYQYFEKAHGHLGARAFQVKVNQVVERDTDGDGFFTAADPQRIDPVGAGTTMYIHRGGAGNVDEPNTWSAGCQTIPGNHYPRFLSTLGRPKNFYYVLVNTVVM